jgi:hypothetical protein
LVSANNSYERTAEDLAMLMGIYIPHSTQQRLVHRQTFEAPIVDEVVNTISIDGGKVRIRTPKGQESVWNDYKAVTIGNQAIGGYFKAQGFTIGSGAVESAVKQIGRRIKISGAQWQAGNVDQVVKHRVAYLNGYFTQSISQRAS